MMTTRQGPRLPPPHSRSNRPQELRARLTLLDSSGFADWRFEQVTGASQSLLGLAPAALTGRSFSDLCEELGPEWWSACERFRNSDELDTEAHSRSLNGWVELELRRISSETASLTVRELSNEARALRLLGNSGEYLRALVNQLRDPLLVHDAQGRILDANEATLDWLGLPRSELSQLSLLDLCQDESEATALEELWQDVLRGSTRTHHWRAKRRGTGKPLLVELSLKRLGVRGVWFIAATLRELPTASRPPVTTASDSDNSHYFELFQSMVNGFCLCEPRRDESAALIGLTVVESNPAFERQGGQLLLSSIAQQAAGTPWLSRFEQVLMTRRPLTVEDYSPSEFEHRRIHLFSPQPAQVALLLEDVSAHSRYETLLRHTTRRAECLLEMAQMHEASNEEISHFVLRNVARLSGGRHCWLGHQTVDGAIDVLHHRQVTQTSVHQGGGRLEPGEFGLWSETYQARSPRLFPPGGCSLTPLSPLPADELEHLDDLPSAMPRGWLTPSEGRLLCHLTVIVPLAPGGENLLLTIANWDGPLLGEVANTLMHLLDSQVHLILQRRATEGQEKLEEQLRMAQKMEAIGQLAGGVAHDLNNLLVPVIGYSELALTSHPTDPDVVESLGHILSAGQKAADLVRRLLAFSRKQVLDLTVLDFDRAVRGVEPMLRHMLRDNVRLSVAAKSRAHVRADVTQLTQILLNLAGNALDAMPKGGELELTTHLTCVDEQAPHRSLRPGTYACLVVRDTGCGMDAATAARVFEPFFTTKPLGQGTGLGLATVFGIVRQHGGGVTVESSPAMGASFRVYFPIATQAETSPSQAPPELIGGDETILLIEDDPGVQRLAVRLLRQKGYQVLVAGTLSEARRVAREHLLPIHLVLSDVLLPDGDGPSTIPELRQYHPELKTLFVSGYTRDSLGPEGAGLADHELLPKPFSAHELLGRLRFVLDRSE